MIPQDILSRKRLWAIADTILLPVIVMCVGASSFFLGRLSALEAYRGHLIIHPPGSGEALAIPTPATADFLGESTNKNTINRTKAETPTNSSTDIKNFAASKNGTKYYLPTCSGVKAIAEANLIYFSTKTEAESAGYTPALNCKGM